MLDPLAQALLFLDGQDPAGSSNHLFGYGRYWSYLPLLAMLVRSFPWGEGGGPMRANAYGTEDGYSGPAPVGPFPLGRSASGAEDLAGNVAEWARREPSEQDDATGAFEIRGGSYRTPFADLGIWNVRLVEAESDSSAFSDVGFRCVRPVD